MKHIDTGFLYSFIKQHKIAVLSTLSPDNKPQSALVGIAVTPDLKLIFDTLSDSRKYHNLIINPSISFVIGWDNEATIQYEGEAIFPIGDELESMKQVYYEYFPEGIERLLWPNISYICVEPKWIRYSDFKTETLHIEELNFSANLSFQHS